MSQTSCERCAFPVPMRRLHAGGDLSRPNHAHQRADRPLTPLRVPAEMSLSPTARACRHAGAAVLK